MDGGLREPADSACSASTLPASSPPPPPPPFPIRQTARCVYLGTADQRLLNISKVKSIIHEGDKCLLLGIGPIFEENISCLLHNYVRQWFSSLHVWGFFFCAQLLGEHQMPNINDHTLQVVSIHHSRWVHKSFSSSAGLIFLSASPKWV